MPIVTSFPNLVSPSPSLCLCFFCCLFPFPLLPCQTSLTLFSLNFTHPSSSKLSLPLSSILQPLLSWALVSLVNFGPCNPTFTSSSAPLTHYSSHLSHKNLSLHYFCRATLSACYSASETSRSLTTSQLDTLHGDSHLNVYVWKRRDALRSSWGNTLGLFLRVLLRQRHLGTKTIATGLPDVRYFSYRNESWRSYHRTMISHVVCVVL